MTRQEAIDKIRVTWNQLDSESKEELRQSLLALGCTDEELVIEKKNTCSTCKYHGEILGFFAECLNPNIKAEGTPNIDGASQADTMGYDPCIYTGLEFGCVLWKAKV